MKKSITAASIIIAIVLAFASTAAATSPYTEHFPSNNANWFMDAAMTNPGVFAPSGGPDTSSHVYMDYSAFGQAGDIILLQARDEFNSSGHAFEGDWSGTGINQFSYFVRHNATVPLQFFARFTRPTSATGVSALKATPVPANTWTKVSFDLDASNINSGGNPTGELFVEGPPNLYGLTFANVGHVQMGLRIPAGFNQLDQTFRYRFDKPSIAAVPEPASIGVVALALILGIVSHRRRATSN